MFFKNHISTLSHSSNPSSLPYTHNYVSYFLNSFAISWMLCQPLWIPMFTCRAVSWYSSTTSGPNNLQAYIFWNHPEPWEDRVWIHTSYFRVTFITLLFSDPSPVRDSLCSSLSVTNRSFPDRVTGCSSPWV